MFCLKVFLKVLSKKQCFVHFIYVKSGEELWFDNDDDDEELFLWYG